MRLAALPLDMRDMGRLLLICGVVLVFAGLFLTVFSRLGLARLPGDIIIRRPGFTIYFPLATSLLLSIVLSLSVWFFRR